MVLGDRTSEQTAITWGLHHTDTLLRPESYENLEMGASSGVEVTGLLLGALPLESREIWVHQKARHLKGRESSQGGRGAPTRQVGQSWGGACRHSTVLGLYLTSGHRVLDVSFIFTRFVLVLYWQQLTKVILGITY